MTRRRAAHLRRINLLIGTILILAGLAGGFLLTFWLLLLLLSATSVAASWIMAWTALRSREGHSVIAILVTVLFLAWFGYFLQQGAGTPMWYGISLMWSLLIIQAASYFLAIRRAANLADMASTRATLPEREGI